MEINLQDKVALVTGAGKGIGREIAKALVKCGATTIALSRTEADLVSLKSEIPEIQTHQIDLGNWKETRQLVEQLGPIDLLVNNAGIARLDHFLKAKKEDLDETFDVNFKAVFNVSQVVAKSMVERGVGGSIVHISSSSSLVALGEHTAYCTSKAAVDMLTKMMALELGPYQIRVNSVNPTVTWTKMAEEVWGDPAISGPQLAKIPMGKFISVEDVVNSVIFLLSNKSAMTNGHKLVIDGGLTTH